MVNPAVPATTDPVLPYIKVRKQFGRQPRFVRDRHRVHCNIHTNRVLHKRFSRFRLLHKAVQACKPWAETPVNTTRRLKVNQGVFHTEGGWPKDISPNEPDMMIRHRKKLEKEEVYQVCLPIMYEKMERYVKQNNAVDFYGEIFKDKWKHRDAHRKTPSAKTILIYEDPSYYQRSVKKIIWAPENVGRMGVCHAPPRFSSALRDSPTEAYFWEVEIASRPESQVRADSHIMDINYHPKDMHSICGGCFDGTVLHWDARVGPNPVNSTPLDICHEDACMGAIWVNSKTNTELFSAGLDGQVLWWDCRNLKERLDSVYLDPEKGNSRKEMALSATILEYEQSVPTKFLVGTEIGSVMLLMRKGKSPGDKLINVFKAHRGPVLNIERNPSFVKNFLTVAESTCKIFSEDCRESPIMWTAPKDVLYTYATWVPSRPSNFVVTRNDGHYDIYDLLKDPARPYLQVKVKSSLQNKKKPQKKYKRELMQDIYLTCAAPCDAPSKLIAIGTSKGNIYMQRQSESLYMSEKADKPLLAQCFERETRREKLIEQRYREIRLRKRDAEKHRDLTEKIAKERAEFAERFVAEAQAEGKTVAPPDYSKNIKYDMAFEARNDPISKAEREFYMELEQEILEKGVEAWAEFAEALATEKKGDTHEKTVESALDITAADLAAFANVEEEEVEYDDDGRPIPKNIEPSKESIAEKAAPPPVKEALAPPPVKEASAPPPVEEAPAPPPVEEAPAPPEEPAPEEQPTETEAIQPPTDQQDDAEATGEDEEEEE